MAAPLKGDDKKLQKTISIEKKKVDKLGIERIRKVAGEAIDKEYNKSLKQ